MRKVRIGPSFTKVVLDALMVLTILRRALADRYDAIHSHEEMGLVGVWLAKWLRHPAPLRHALEPAAAVEQLQIQPVVGAARLSSPGPKDQMVHKSQVVITICQELQDTVAEMGAGDRSLLIENVMGGDVDEPPSPIAGGDPRGVGHRSAARRWRSTPERSRPIKASTC